MIKLCLHVVSCLVSFPVAGLWASHPEWLKCKAVLKNLDNVVPIGIRDMRTCIYEEFYFLLLSLEQESLHHAHEIG